MQVFPCEVALIDIPPDRQREDLGDLSGLQNSMQQLGILSPIIVRASGPRWALVAGERRLTSAKALGWKSILARDYSDLSMEEQVLVELDENLRRKQLTWQEEVRAVAKYVSLRPDSTQAEVARALNLSDSTLSAMVRTAEGIDADARLAEAKSWTAAYDILRIRANKAADAAVEEILADSSVVAFPLLGVRNAAGAPPADGSDAAPRVGAHAPIALGGSGDTAPPPSAPTPPPRPFYAIRSDFAEWAPGYAGLRYNFLHCDFPYGLNMHKTKLQGSQSQWDTEESGRYSDEPELFDRLVRCFFQHQDRFVADSAHCIFWLAAKNYWWVADLFRSNGWVVCETPLIWHKSDNAGIAPDVRRWPRRTYEIAIFASRGDRKITKVKSASVALPTTKEHHLSEKPLDMLSYFFEMVVDEHTTILDPTCGSGTALRAARALGAASGLGMDVLEDHVLYTNGKLA